MHVLIYIVQFFPLYSCIIYSAIDQCVSFVERRMDGGQMTKRFLKNKRIDVYMEWNFKIFKIQNNLRFKNNIIQRTFAWYRIFSSVVGAHAFYTVYSWYNTFEVEKTLLNSLRINQTYRWRNNARALSALIMCNVLKMATISSISCTCNLQN